ncbi:gonadotropin-releasing hormone receptor-like [Penaeus monodon]|uniref:gonadotropin-releasing hormone receptor-like n=1 Tax=Penaeus monodon TaxID=6687 RepID=UPI0018A7C7CD|nr:gonadotropin-releasing hormone receptor-like [Penaeus monodon]
MDASAYSELGHKDIRMASYLDPFMNSSDSLHFTANLSRVAEEEESFGNQSLPIDMRFNDGHILLISCYSGIFIVSLVGNLCVLKAILGGGRKQRKSRVNLMLLHLAIADLIVTTIMIPVEVGWSATVQWMAGDTFCRVFAFFRIFGHYLSSFILVCISIDRYFAVVYPLSLNAADRRGKIMLTFAWFLAFTCSLPQTAIRRSSLGYLGRARARTIKMTISIVLAFFVCWTPYVVISLWFCFDRSAAELLDVKVQKGLFFFACTNSCVNPIVYGIFNFCKKKQPIQTQTWRSTTLNTQINSRGFECRSFKSSRVYWGRREQESTATNSEATDHTAELLLPRTLNSSFRARSHSGSESATSIHLQTLGSTSSMSRRQIAERNNSGSSPLTTQYRNGSYYSAPSKSRCHEENGNPV